MTTQETKVTAVNRDALDAERNALLNAYRIQFDVWKVQNDNYFKRVQILMVVIQAALFTIALRFIPPKSEPWYEIFIPVLMAILGILSACHWISLNEKQSQYMEFCRRTLRNLESRLVEVGIPLRYFTLEAHVFGPLRTEISNSAGTSVQTEEGRQVAHFAWSRENYPDKKTENYPDPDKKEVNIHELRKVGGGMMAFEKRIARGVLYVWVAIGLTLLIVTVIVRGVCP